MTTSKAIWWTMMVGMMLLLQHCPLVQAAFEDDPCATKGKTGVCKTWDDCPIMEQLIKSREYSIREVVSCGFGTHEELICCPIIRSETKIDDTTSTEPNVVKPTPKPDILDERPAVRACHRIEKGLNASITNHILDGIPTELGEFPHMAAIGYSRIGDDDRGPYDIRCGGTLIDSRFVLTAAHCVASRDSVPSIVRMGVVNFTDPEEMLEAVEIRIKQVHIHNDYSTRKTYNDIAILELERPAPYSKFIYPACLYTDAADPKPNVRLWVTGWGTVNTKTRAFSNILLKAPLHATPLEKCNASFVDYGLTRQIDKGVIATQMCAEDDQQLKDACQGDSGGPLNLLVDESLNNYRIVGVVSSGFGCASSTPGLYTRVAAFLDFVEQIVWPNGGD